MFCHNLHYMAPFAIPNTGFRIVFQRASFVFRHARGRIFEPGIGFLDPGSTFWPGDLFGVKNWSRKKLCCDGIILWLVGREFPKTQMNSIIYRTHLGRLLCPKPWFLNYFQGISNIQENWGTPRKHPPVYPLFPFVDPLFPINSR